MNDVAQQLTALQQMSTGELCERYRELFGQAVRTRHKAYLVRKLAWRIQELAEGGLSERARRRAAELANDADVRVMPPRATVAPTIDRVAVAAAPTVAAPDPRLPAPGTAIVRRYKGRDLRVLVLPDGFEFDGERYKTLTAVAEHVTGSHLNGYRFFRLGSRS